MQEVKKWDDIKLKSLFMAKEKINRLKRRPTQWEGSLPAMHLTQDWYAEYIKNSKI